MLGRWLVEECLSPLQADDRGPSSRDERRTAGASVDALELPRADVTVDILRQMFVLLLFFIIIVIIKLLNLFRSSFKINKNRNDNKANIASKIDGWNWRHSINAVDIM